MQLSTDLVRQRWTNQLAGGNNLTPVHEDIYRLLALLLPAGWREQSLLEACVPGKPPLRLQLREQFTYTDEIALFYATGQNEDIMVARMYHDARVAELHHCNFAGYFLRRLGPAVSAGLQAGNRRSQNEFFRKWLVFLLDAGYQHRPWRTLADNVA